MAIWEGLFVLVVCGSGWYYAPRQNPGLHGKHHWPADDVPKQPTSTGSEMVTEVRCWYCMQKSCWYARKLVSASWSGSWLGDTHVLR